MVSKIKEIKENGVLWSQTAWENKELRKCYRIYTIPFFVFAISHIGLLLQTMIVNWSSQESMIERGFSPYEIAGFLCLIPALTFFGMAQAIWQAEVITRKKQ